MRRVAFFMMATLTSVAVFGQSLLDCIEPDVLRALLLQSQGERPPVITATVPVELSALKMPREFTWIGSAERITGRVDATTNATQVTAAWRSSLAPDAARVAASTALTASGWEVRPLPGVGVNVFTFSTQASTPACREGRPVNVTASVMDGVTYVLFLLQRGNIGNTICNQPVRPVAMPGSSAGLDQYLPHLEMPLDPAIGAMRMQSANTSYSGSAVSASTQFTVKDSIGNVAQHFARQMAEQGWSRDANWNGAASAGSSWSRTAAAGALIEATLSVTTVAEQQFLATLHVTRLQ